MRNEAPSLPSVFRTPNSGRVGVGQTFLSAPLPAGQTRMSAPPNPDTTRVPRSSLVVAEQVADRLVLVDAADGVGQESRHRDDLDVRQLLLGRQRDAVGDRQL